MRKEVGDEQKDRFPSLPGAGRGRQAEAGGTKTSDRHSRFPPAELRPHRGNLAESLQDHRRTAIRPAEHHRRIRQGTGQTAHRGPLYHRIHLRPTFLGVV